MLENIVTYTHTHKYIDTQHAHTNSTDANCPNIENEYPNTIYLNIWIILSS